MKVLGFEAAYNLLVEAQSKKEEKLIKASNY